MFYLQITNLKGLIDASFHLDSCNNNANSVAPHTHEYHEIVLVKKGVLCHHINGMYFEAPENTLFFIRNTDKHFYESNAESKKYCEWLNFAFHDEALQNLFSFLNVPELTAKIFSQQYPPQILLSSFDKSSFIEKFKKLQIYNLNPTNEKKYELRLFLFEVITKYFLATPSPKNEDSDWFYTLISKMMKYENFTCGYPRLLELCPKSKATLQRAIKKEYGVSATEFCNNLRLSYISQQLVTSTASITDIIFNAGFFNLSYAYNLFRKKYGVSPASYRKNQISHAPSNDN